MRPSTNGSNGRDALGRFGAGNPGGPGNPFAARVGAWRQTLWAASTPKDIAEVWRALVDQAKTGDVAACREVLDRTVGRPRHEAEVEAARVARIEVVDATPAQLERIMEFATPAQQVEQRILDVDGEAQ